MKKIISIFLVLVMCLSLSACKSEEVKAVEEAIASIGTVTDKSEKAIKEAEKAYSALSDDDKNKVDNYNTLVEARSKYDAMPKKISLSASNYKNYLNFDIIYGDCKTEEVLATNIYYKKSDVKLNVYPIKPGKFSDVKMEVRIICHSGWEVNSSDSAYDENNTRYIVFDISLPTDGEYTSETHNIISAAELVATKISSPENCEVKVVNMSGTFIEEK